MCEIPARHGFAVAIAFGLISSLTFSIRHAAGDSGQAKVSGSGEQTKPLFDEIRDAIPKLKVGMTADEVRRVLMVKKLKWYGSWDYSRSYRVAFYLSGRFLKET
jgi:hypothetical protein